MWADYSGLWKWGFMMGGTVLQDKVTYNGAALMVYHFSSITNCRCTYAPILISTCLCCFTCCCYAVITNRRSGADSPSWRQTGCYWCWLSEASPASWCLPSGSTAMPSPDTQTQTLGNQQRRISLLRSTHVNAPCTLNIHCTCTLFVVFSAMKKQLFFPVVVRTVC